MKRAIVTYAAGAHEELLDVALPSYREFAERHKYDLLTTRGDLVETRNYLPYTMPSPPPAWNKVPLLLHALSKYDEVVWLDCDLVIVDTTEDFPPMVDGKCHALVRHFENNSEVPNSGVWRLRRHSILASADPVPLLHKMMDLEVFEHHGWWEQAALLTLMGYCVPPQGHEFSQTKCRAVRPTKWHQNCEFMRLCWNSHPNYRADYPKIVHCSYPDMAQRLEVMRALATASNYNYPRYDKPKKVEEEE